MSTLNALEQRAHALRKGIDSMKAELVDIERQIAQAHCPFQINDVIVHLNHPNTRFLVCEINCSTISGWELKVARFKNNGFPAQRQQRLWQGLNRLSKVGTWSRPS